MDTRNLHNGTMQNGATFGAGRVGQAFSLDGTNDAILLGKHAGLQPASITLEAWINVNSITNGEVQNVFAKWGFDATVDSYLFSVLNNCGRFRSSARAATARRAIRSGSFPTIDGKLVRQSLDGGNPDYQFRCYRRPTDSERFRSLKFGN